MPCGKYLKSYGQFTPVPDSACRFPIHSPLTATLHTSLVNLVPVHARRETLATCAPSGRLSIHNRHQGARGVIHTRGVTITSFSILSVRPNSPHQLLGLQHTKLGTSLVLDAVHVIRALSAGRRLSAWWGDVHV